MEIGKNAGNHHILLFQLCFQNLSMFVRVFKTQDCVEMSKPFPSYILILIHERKKLLEYIVGKGETEQFHLFIRPSKTGSPVAGRRGGGGRPHSLSGAYLQDYASYGYEISWVDRSH